jgi:hypothetical protein
MEYEILFTYLKEVNTINTAMENKNIMAIDLGINNLASIIISNNKSFIIDGKYLKSVNQFYNKKLSYFCSKKPNNKFFLYVCENGRFTYCIPKKSIQHDGVLLWSQLLLKLVCMYELSY